MKVHRAGFGLLMASLAAAVILQACGSKPPPAPPPPSAWSVLTMQFIEASFKAEPTFAVRSGRHEFDGQIGDLSAAGIKAVDTATLSDVEKLERENLLVDIDTELFWDETAEAPFTNPQYYEGAVDPDTYLSSDYAPLETRMKAYITYARNIPAAAASIRANLRTPLPKSYVEYGVGAFGGFGDFYRNDVPKVFADIHDPDLQQQLTDANARAATAMDELRDWFVAQRKAANQNFALGKERFAKMLADTERIDLPLATIEAAGRADLARNQAALQAECAVYAPGATLAACMDRMRAHKAGASAVEGARAQLADLKAFIVKNNVVSIPGPVDALVAETPPYDRAFSAYIKIPGPYDKDLPAIYYISPPDPKWTARERAAYVMGQGVLLFTSVHEVWPGHYLQYMHANLNPSKVLALWGSTGFAEGWAHYGEEAMYELGLGQGNPELHIGQIEEALLRNVRLISAIGMHTEGMTQAQSEKLFLTQAFQDPGDARQEAARGTFDPGYLSYTLNKLFIRKLRSDWVAAHNPAGADPKTRWHDFHDQFLSYGAPPVAIVRQIMMGETPEQAAAALL
jgi:hypothetical protein